MSIFYLLPPRPFLADRFADFMQTYFPGLSWDHSARMTFADLLGEAAARDDVFVIYRDELPCAESTPCALVDGFGAEPGDEVIEVRAGGKGSEVITRRWRIERR